MENISDRLLKIASLVDKDDIFADVGTDHAYIPVYLITNGISSSGIASDINKGPLKVALKNLTENQVEDKVKLVLSPGLDCVDVSDVDTIIVAGMGGDLICSILTDANEKITSQKLILQPMTAVPTVRKYLFDNEYIIKKEVLSQEKDKIYNIIKCEKGNTKSYNTKDVYFGTNLENEDRKLLTFYIKKLITKYTRRIGGLKRAKDDHSQELEKYENIINMLKEVEKNNVKGI